MKSNTTMSTQLDDDLLQTVSTFLEEISSSPLDSKPPVYRRDLYHEYETLIDSYADEKGIDKKKVLTLIQEYISSKVALDIADRTSSKHAQKRLVKYFIQIIIQNVLTHNVQNEENDNPVLDNLIHCLCRLLLKAQKCGNGTLLDVTLRFLDCTIPTEIKQFSQDNNNNGDDENINPSYEKTIISSILQSCSKFLSRIHDQDHDEEYEGDWSTCLSLWTYLSAQKSMMTSTEAISRQDLVQLFLKYTFTSKKRFATCYEMNLSKCFISSLTTVELDSLLPTLGLKMRSNPEGIIETSRAFLSHLDGSKVNISQHFEDSDAKLLSSVSKQLSSKKPHVCELASSILTQLYTLGSTASDSVVLHLLGCLGHKGTSSATKVTPLSTPDQRIKVYETLNNIINSKDSTSNLAPDTCSLVLEVISATLERETTADAKKVGYKTLTYWLIHGEKSTDGYKKALDYITKPIISSTSNSAEFRFRIGSLYTMNHLSFEKVDDLLREVLAHQSQKILGALQNMVEGAVKKHSGTSTSPQVDGLIAIYLILLQATSLEQMPSIPAPVMKVLTSGSSSLNSKTSSFLFSNVMIDATSTDTLLSYMLHRVVQLYTIYVSNSQSDEKQKYIVRLTGNGEASSATFAVASCILYAKVDVNTRTLPVESTIQSILEYSPEEAKASDALMLALFTQVNVATYDHISDASTMKLAREAIPPIVEESVDEPSEGVHLYCIRSISLTLLQSVTNVDALCQGMILSHLGSKKSKSLQHKARATKLEDVLSDIIIPFVSKDVQTEKMLPSLISAFASSQCVEISQPSDAKDKGSEKITLSNIIHTASMNLLGSLGEIGGCYLPEEADDPDDDDNSVYKFARNLCVQDIAPCLASHLARILPEVEALKDDDVGLYRTLDGVLYTDNNSESDKKDDGVQRNKKLHGDEEWEMQVKKEIAEKREAERAAQSASSSLTQADKELIEKQTNERKRIRYIIDGDFTRTLQSIQSLCLSDIEVGNSIIPELSNILIATAISNCEIFSSLRQKRELAYNTLYNLASCVYELDDNLCHTLTRTVLVSYNGQKPGTKFDQIKPHALPSPCESAAAIIAGIEEYGDALNSCSFHFIFPILRALLTGPRTPPGCEKVLKILNMQVTELRCNHELTKYRKDIAYSVLELLTHDRSLAFKDPNPNETLVNIYSTSDDDDDDDDKSLITPSELAPLLGEAGALGPKNCRIASMVALSSILTINPGLLKSNNLVENRIWLNCFSFDESLKSEARKAWCIAHGIDYTNDQNKLPNPSIFFAVPLLSVLSNQDEDLAQSAAVAYACALERHQNVIEKDLIRLFNLYIDSYPTIFEDKSEKSDEPVPVISKPKPSKPAISTDLKPKLSIKKKTVKAPSAIAMITTTKKKSTVKSKAVLSMLAPKPIERTFDENILSSQFESNCAVTSKAEERDSSTKILVRKGVIRVITSVSHPDRQFSLNIPTLKLLVGFLLAYGLSDGNENVCAAARDALRDVVATRASSEDASRFILTSLEASLRTGEADKSELESLNTDKILEDIPAKDRRKEGVVIAIGSAAIHLNDDRDADKIEEVINMLMTALNTPSESVQSSVALALSKLMKKGKTQDNIQPLLDGMMDKCLTGETLAVRRGAAYGVSAIVKGSGIASLKKFDVVSRLENACNTGSSNSKEGALFAIELLSERLGLLFEPYVIVLLPALLKSFGDTSIHVRNAATACVGLIMSKLSGHGVKLLMPAVLSGLENEDWRTKQASIHMVGAMSHCAPKQLANCLPKVVPKLTEAFSDTHPKVKAGAKEALEDISKVIRNPEISQISSVLLLALTDPSTGTTPALESLIETEFLHAIDAPSLALIVPVLHRGLRDRAATTKRYGALITGNICTMINDPRDFVPYLPILLPDLKSVLIDPIPDCRSTSAKALGSLTRSLGESTFPELRSWLIDTLKGDEESSVERSGAAQGLTEVLCAGGASLVETVMREEILPLINHPKATNREGVLWVLTFLPSSLGQAFAPLIHVSFPVLISGLSDDHEPVRDVAMRAGRVMIRTHGKAHVEKILPTLENGLVDDDYRMRAAALNLLGDLFSMIGGTKIAKGDADTQDDIRQAERAQAQVALVLGPETRKRVLSSLYFRRSDSASVVRQNALQVWKTVVSNTGRTLREILDTLVDQIVSALASGNPDNTLVAGRCLGDIVNKLGDTVLPDIIPVLRHALSTGGLSTRLGACVGLNEVIASAEKEQLVKCLDILSRAVRDALCDDDENIRNIAASCFQKLYSTVGNKVLDEFVPALLAEMESGTSDDDSRIRAVNGLTGILKVRSRELLPYLVPRMLRTPITQTQAFALSNICAVSGSTIYSFFSSIIPTILFELSNFFGVTLSDDEQQRETALRSCVRSVSASLEETNISPFMNEIVSKCSSDKDGIRKESCWMFQVLIEERKDKLDMHPYISLVLRELLNRLNDSNQEVLKATNMALFSLTNNINSEELVNHLNFIRNLIASIVSDARRRKGGVGDGEFLLPGLNMPKGLEPLLPIYQRGILYGNAEMREASAAGLGELIDLTSSKFLAGPFLVKVTGPLLRIVGDRNPSTVKVAIIRTLGKILLKSGPALRAFVPQFQTTFFKALSDPSRQVRVEAIKAFALLMPLSTRVDPLIKELISNASGNSLSTSTVEHEAGAVAIQTASLLALATVLKHGGAKATCIPSVLDACKILLNHDDKSVRDGAAKVLGCACEILGASTANDISRSILSSQADSKSEVKHGIACFCARIISSSIRENLESDIVANMMKIVRKLLSDEELFVKEAACIATGALIGITNSSNDYFNELESTILKIMDPKMGMELLRSMAKGLTLAVVMKSDLFWGKRGLKILDAALKNSMNDNQRVQIMYQEFLWLALNVKDGEGGLQMYCNETMFENAKAMKSLHSKVLIRIKDIEIDE